MTFWYNNNIKLNLTRLIEEYSEIKDIGYKKHKFGYINGFNKMVQLYNENQYIINDIMKMISDFNKTIDTKNKIYTASDIISYNDKFKIFFGEKCNEHLPHELI